MKGQTLIEAMVGLSVAALIISMISIAVVSSLSNANHSKDQNLSTQFATEGMEVVRQIKNSDRVTFNAFSGTYCLPKDSVILGPDCTSPNIDTAYIRKVTIAQNGCAANVARVTSTVFWAGSKCSSTNQYCTKVELVSCFSN